MKYRRRVIKNNVRKFRGGAIFRTRFIRQMVSLKAWRRHVGACPRDSNMAAGNQWKHLGFTLVLSKRFFSLLNLKTFALALLSTYWLLRTRKHKANRYFRARNMLTRNNADVTHCEKTVFCFQSKAVYRAEDRPTDIRLKMSFTRHR